MSGDDNKRAVAEFVERCQNQHDLAFADEAFHPKFVNHYRPEGQAIPQADRPASGFQAFYGALLQGFPDATMEINEQLAERDLVATRKTFRGRTSVNSGICRRPETGSSSSSSTSSG
jgi:predicted ester cyclase